MSRLLSVHYMISLIGAIECARILAYYPTPALSHQIVFRPLTLGLVKRGHEVVVITPDPIFPKGKAPANLTEIDIHDISYKFWRATLQALIESEIGTEHYIPLKKSMISMVEQQIGTEEVQQLLKDKSKTFDLIILEVAGETSLGLSHLYKAPVIQFSSFSAGSVTLLDAFGAASHQLLYPASSHRRVYNLTIFEKILELYRDYKFNDYFPKTDDLTNEAMKRMYGPDVPKMNELRKNVDMLFLNVHPIWDFNRPVPPNVIYLGGLHQKPAEDLPQDLQTYLDSSKNGVIYVSFGTNVNPELFPPEKIQIFINVFSKLPYDILWKWNNDELPGRTPNIRISKWLPQSNLLRHSKIKLFITQCGLQSTDEAITAGVPLLGMPVFGDQFFNSEQYLYYGIGVRVDMESVTEEKLNQGINMLLHDDSYRKNIVRLRSLMHDQPESSLERAVWWTEYVIRHSGAGHLRSPSVNVPWHQYYELELVVYLLLGIFTVIALLVSVVVLVCNRFCKNKIKVKAH